MSGRAIESFGPVFGLNAYYRDRHKNDAGSDPKISPSDQILKWDKRDGNPIDNFVSLNPSVLSCKPSLLEKFLPLIAGQYIPYPFSIEDTEYVSIRPNRFLDLFDEKNSIYSTLPSGTKSNFREIYLNGLPPGGAHFFGLDGDLTLNVRMIVSNEFKRVYEENELTGLRFKRAFPRIS